jgi:hypothetical protein
METKKLITTDSETRFAALFVEELRYLVPDDLRADLAQRAVLCMRRAASETTSSTTV